MEVFVLLWEYRDSSPLVGVFATPAEAKTHLEKEMVKLAEKRKAEMDMWKGEALAASGNDAKHSLYMAQLVQNELDAGMTDVTNEPSGHRYGPLPSNTVVVYHCYGEEFSIAKWEVGTGNILF